MTKIKTKVLTMEMIIIQLVAGLEVLEVQGIEIAEMEVLEIAEMAL